MPIKIVRKGAAPTAPLVKDAIVVRPKKSHGKTMDSMCLTVAEMSGKMPVGWFLAASYLYYIHDMSLLTDEFYDRLARGLLADYDQISEYHGFKALVTKEALEAGSMYHIRADQYSPATRGFAKRMVQTEWGIDIDMYKDCDQFEAEG